MKQADIHTFAKTGDIKTSLYWTGSRDKLSKGYYEMLEPVYVLDEGFFTTYMGDCGPAVVATKVKVPRRYVVAVRRQAWSTNGRTYAWTPKLIGAGAILISDAELQERRKLKKADEARHLAMRKAADKERNALLDTLNKSIDPVVYFKAGTVRIDFAREWDRKAQKYKDDSKVSFVNVTIKPEQLSKVLSKEGKEALEALKKFKYPQC